MKRTDATQNIHGTGTPGGGGGVVALLTPPGRGALAVVGAAGAGAEALVDAVFVARGGRPVAGRADGAIAFGSWGGAGGEDVVVVRHAAERLEVHCHGGLAAAAAIVASLVARGAREIDWRQWLAGCGRDAGAVAAEAREALPLAGGPKAARILCRQLAGTLDAEIARIERLVAVGEGDAASAAVARLLRAARVGLRLTRPWRVVVAGTVNAGKSSLVNALAGHARAIVSPIPGTTRDLVETRLVLDGWEIELIDTAGIRAAPAGAVEAAGIARATAAAATADLVLRVVPADAAHACPAAGPQELVVLSKGDLAPSAQHGALGAIRTSAVTGAGIEELARCIVAAVVPEETAEPDLLAGAVPFTQRQIDVVRELMPRTM
jgi:tRNA modification GTPase